MTLKDRVAKELGILPQYTAIDGQIYQTTDAAKNALLEALGFDPYNDGALSDALAGLTAPRAWPLWLVLDIGATPTPPGPWRLTYEDRKETEGAGTLPPLPLGIHRVEIANQITWLIAAPPTLPLPQKGWGVTLPLYGIKPSSGGLATYRDLATLVQGLGARGAGFAGINPIHAGFPTDPTMISPYSPSHRRRFSTDLLDAQEAAPACLPDRIDYASTRTKRRAALQARFQATSFDPDFGQYLAEEGQPLQHFARHQALSDVYGPYWTDWPKPLQDADPVTHVTDTSISPDDVLFHAWCQWQAEIQLHDAATAARTMTQGLYLDLAVGTHPHGAETWMDPASFAQGVSLGAPPDDFAPQGQSWTLAPFHPLRLAATGFAVLAETLRKQLQFAGMLRIDHILGFERAFWVPDNGAPGAYVQMPREAMLAVVRIEAARAGAVIVGEDLGVVPDGLRSELSRSGILGCTLAMFERDGDDFLDPSDHRPASLASFGTHDLPPHAGWRKGRDIEVRETLGLSGPDPTALGQRAADVAAFDRMANGASLPQVLAQSAASLVALQLEDITGAVDQMNLPGTTGEFPNWQRRLDLAAEEVGAYPDMVEAACVMKDSKR